MNQRLTYIDLFCGAGGFSLGFEQMGYKNLFSIDIEPNYCKTYKSNFPKHLLIQKDISNVGEDEILAYIRNKKVDVVIGGPPCQGFSMAGNIGRKFIEDSRNQLFKEFARVVAITKPTYFVMENVARLFTHNQGKTKSEIINLFEELGYNVTCQIVNSADFGVAQIRKRVLFIGNKISNHILFPQKSVSKYKTIQEAIQNFPILKSGEKSHIPNHVAMKHSEQMLAKMSYISNGGNRLEIPVEIRPQSGDVRKYIRYNSEEPAVCITGDMRKIFHYSQNRALTVRELAKIQSFPDDFIFKGSSLSQQQQVGNSVPPLMAKEIAATLLKMIQHDSTVS